MIVTTREEADLREGRINFIFYIYFFFSAFSTLVRLLTRSALLHHSTVHYYSSFFICCVSLLSWTSFCICWAQARVSVGIKPGPALQQDSALTPERCRTLIKLTQKRQRKFFQPLFYFFARELARAPYERWITNRRVVVLERPPNYHYSTLSANQLMGTRRCLFINQPSLKGVGQERIFLKALKIKAVLYACALMVLTFFGCFVVTNQKLWLASMKALIESKNHLSNPLQRPCRGIQKATYDYKYVAGSRLWGPEIVLKAAYGMKFCVHFSCILARCRVDTGENPPMTEKESRNSSIAAFGILFWNSKCFHRSKQNLCICTSQNGSLKYLKR